MGCHFSTLLVRRRSAPPHSQNLLYYALRKLWDIVLFESQGDHFSINMGVGIDFRGLLILLGGVIQPSPPPENPSMGKQTTRLHPYKK